MDSDKHKSSMYSSILQECRELLLAVNCEIFNNVSERTLFNILFESNVKKELLLDWAIKQFYSPDICKSTPLEDLVCAFIPKQQFKNFMNSTMSIEEQHKIWKLVVKNLYRVQHIIPTENMDPVFKVELERLIEEDSALINRLQALPNESFGMDRIFMNSLSGSRKVNLKEMETELQSIRRALSVKNGDNKQETEGGSKIDEATAEGIMESMEKMEICFEKFMKENVEPILPRSQDEHSLQYVLHQTDLDLKDIDCLKARFGTLHKFAETFQKIITGVENIKAQDLQEETFNDSSIS